MRAFVYLTVSLLSFVSLYAQNNKTSMGAYMDYKTECLGVDLDGSQLVKSYAKGFNKKESTENAKKTAINDILFSGISLGNGGCDAKPLIFNPNAREQNQAFFNQFFADGGVYSKFINKKELSIVAVFKSKNKKVERVYSVSMKVDITNLRKELINKGIIQKEL